jgi:hypothetical protein
MDKKGIQVFQMLSSLQGIQRSPDQGPSAPMNSMVVLVLALQTPAADNSVVVLASTLQVPKMNNVTCSEPFT